MCPGVCAVCAECECGRMEVGGRGALKGLCMHYKHPPPKKKKKDIGRAG